jgi:replication factor C subunit 3/5
VLQTCQLKQRTVCPGKDLDVFNSIKTTDGQNRVEKYRPDTLEDVSGHQDILATINKFVDTNVREVHG